MFPEEVADGLRTHPGCGTDLVEGVPFGDVRVVLVGEEAVHGVPIIEAESAYHMGLDSAFLEHGVEPAVGDIILFHYLFSCHPLAQIFAGTLDGVADIEFFCSFGCNFVQVFPGDADGTKREALERNVVLLDNLIQGVPRHLE